MTTLTTEELLSMASEFTVMTDFANRCFFAVQRRFQQDETVKWIVSDGSFVWSKSQRVWIYDHTPSSRPDEHLADTRHDTLQEAIDVAMIETHRYRELGYLKYWREQSARTEALE